MEHLYHLVPAQSRAGCPSAGELAVRLMNEMDEETALNIGNESSLVQTWLGESTSADIEGGLQDEDGVVTEAEFVSAFQRSEHLTVLLINKLINRFNSVNESILKD